MILDEERTNILAFDPSMLYTGWLLYKPHKIVRYGCIRRDKLLAGRDITGVMNMYSEFQIAMSNELVSIMRLLDPECTHVVLEQPQGSQNVKAAWGMAMASSVVISTSISMFRRNPIYYTQDEAKKYMFQTGTVPKGKTMKTMWSYWRGQGVQSPEKHWEIESNSERRKCMEAVADAMLILNIHLNKLYNGLDVQNR